uniref:CRISPR-associated protein Csn2-St n=1 Tax=Candidatus Enterococcus willemsii TaxID=1857215 RepID=UPI00403F6EB0
MEIAIEYEFGNYLEFEGEEITFILGANHEIKWKLYRGLKRFVTGKSLSELEENVYGDDGIVIKCDGKKMNAKNLPVYFLDCRESFLEQYRYTRGSMMQKYIDSLESEFQVIRQLDILNDEILKMEIDMQNDFSASLQHVIPLLKPITYKELTKYFLELSFLENEVVYPVEMMDIAMLIDDYCTLIREEVLRTQKKTWLWINNPNSFISKAVFTNFVEKLRFIAKETKLLHIFIMSDDYVEFSYQEEDISNTILVYDNSQQLPEFGVLMESLSRFYPDEIDFQPDMLISALYRIFPYVGWKYESQKVYLKEKDMVLLKVVTQLLNCQTDVKYTEIEQNLSVLERKFLLS